MLSVYLRENRSLETKVENLRKPRERHTQKAGALGPWGSKVNAFPFLLILLDLKEQHMYAMDVLRDFKLKMGLTEIKIKMLAYLWSFLSL